MASPIRRFWEWYEAHYTVATGVAAGLFVLQVVHLYWLTADVVAFRLVGRSFFSPTPFWRTLILLVDYTEIPAIVIVSLVYVNALRKSFALKDVTYLVLLNLQWIHILWITDEFVVSMFTGEPGATFPVWLAWIAILIDYLELPVIVETVLRFLAALEAGSLDETLEGRLRRGD